MTSYQEQEGLPAEDIKSSCPDYRQLVAELDNKLQKSRRTLEQAESAFDAADEAVFSAESSAEESEKAYQASHELLQTLLAEEESMRSATEMANSLATDASSLKTDKATNYSDLLHQAMSALLTVSANAEQKLAEKRQQREKAQHHDQILHLEAASSRLNAYTTGMRRAKTEYFRLHAANELELTESQYKLAKIRRELMDLLQQVKDGRKSLEDNIAAYYSAIDEAEQLTEATKRHQEELEELNENLSRTSAQIIPYETLVNDLQHDESSLLESYSKAAEEAEAAYQQQMLLTKAFEEAIGAEQKKEQSAKDQLSELYKFNKKLAQNEEQKLKDAAAAMDNAVDLAEQAQRELAENKAQIPVLEKGLVASQEALEKAHNTAQETARMVANVQAVKLSMKENSTKILSGAETVLQNTLEAANNIILEKEAASSRIRQNLDETKKVGVFLQQAAEKAQQAYENLSRTYDAVQAEQNQLREKIQQSEKQLKDITEHQCSEARNHRISTETELRDAEKFTADKRKIAEELKQRLQELRIEYKNAVESRDEMKRHIYEINTRIEVEKMQETSDRENRIIALWESSEKLQIHIREAGQQLQRNIDNVHKLSMQEQRCIKALERTQEQVNQSMEALHKQRILSLDDYESMVSELKKALDDYRQNPIAMLQQSEYSANILAANMILENSETATAEYIQRPMRYELEIGDYTDIDPNLISVPVPQIDSEQAEKSQALLQVVEATENSKAKTESTHVDADEPGEATINAELANELAATSLSANTSLAAEKALEKAPPTPEEETMTRIEPQTTLEETRQDTPTDEPKELSAAESAADDTTEKTSDLRNTTEFPETPENKTARASFESVPLTSNNPDLLNQLLALVSSCQKHDQDAATTKSTVTLPMTEIAIPEDAANNQLPFKDSTDLLAEMMMLIGSNVAHGFGTANTTEPYTTREDNTAIAKAAVSLTIGPKEPLSAPSAQDYFANTDHTLADNYPVTVVAADNTASSFQNSIDTETEQTSPPNAQKTAMDAADNESSAAANTPDSYGGDRLLELMSLIGNRATQAPLEPVKAEKYTIDQTAEEATQIHTGKQLPETTTATEKTMKATVEASAEDMAAVYEAVKVAAETTYHENTAAPLPTAAITDDVIEKVIAQEPVEENSEIADDFEYLSGDFSYIDNSGDDLVQLLEDIATLRSGIERTAVTIPDTAPAESTQESQSVPVIHQYTPPATESISAHPLNTGRDIISNDISNQKHLLSSDEKKRLEALDAAFKASQEDVARIESERLRKEEEAAQLKAEQEAALRAIEEQKAAEKETNRLTRLAEAASQQFSLLPDEQRKDNETIALSPGTTHKDEEEDDLEAELRRIIFSDFC